MATTSNVNRVGKKAMNILNPPLYVKATVVVCIGGLLNGLDTSTIGPVTGMASFSETFGPISASLQGIIVAIVTTPGALTSLFSGSVADSIGRTRAIAIGALLFAVGAALEAASVNLAMFMIGRCIVGLGQGLFLASCLVYVYEITPPRWRGPLATLVQLFCTLGLVVGFFACYGTVEIDSSLSWRLPLAIQAGFSALLMMLATFYLPHSPRWLTYKGRKQEASEVWDRLGVSAAEREKEQLQEARITSQLQTQEVQDSSNVTTGSDPASATHDMEKQTFTQRFKTNTALAFRLLTHPNLRKPFLFGLFLMSMQQLSGIDAVIIYAPLLFQQAGLSTSSAAFLASGVSAILIFATTTIAVIFAHRWGHRAMTLYGGSILLTCMTLMGLLYATNNVHGDSGAGRWIVIVCIYIFSCVYSMTWAFGLKIYSSEIQPVETRAAATSIAQAANFLTNFLVAFVTPILLEGTTYGAYFLFGGCLGVTLLVAGGWMVETRGRELEEVGVVFLNHQGWRFGRSDGLVAKGWRWVRRIVGKLRVSPHVSPDASIRELNAESVRSAESVGARAAAGNGESNAGIEMSVMNESGRAARAAQHDD